MQIKILGQVSDKFQRIIEEVTTFTLSQLLSQRILNNINIKIILHRSHFNKDKDLGVCDFKLTYPIRDFTLHIYAGVPQPKILLTLFHELVHIRQYAVGDLAPTYRHVSHVRWEGVWLDTETHNYYDLPWEIEAHGRERGLYIRWLNGSTVLSNRAKEKFRKSIPY